MLNEVWLIYFNDKCFIAGLHYLLLFTISTKFSFHHVQEYENILLLDLRKNIKRKIVQTIYKSFLSKKPPKQQQQTNKKPKTNTKLFYEGCPKIM